MRAHARRLRRSGLAIAIVGLALHAHMHAGGGDANALDLRAVKVAKPGETLTIHVLRWPTEAERAPLLTALAPPAPREAGPGGAAEGRGGRGAPAGRGARGRGAAPASPMVRFAAAVKAAPTCGYIWGGITGYSIKYAWRSPASGPTERIVLITDRRIALQVAPPAPASVADADADFTVLEIRLDGAGTGEGKTSLMTNVVVDQPAGTLALQDYAAATPLLRISR